MLVRALALGLMLLASGGVKLLDFGIAKARLEAMMADEMKAATGGLPLPPGLKL